MKKRRRSAADPILRQMGERGIEDADEFDAWLAARGWAWQGLDRGEYGVDLEAARILYTFEDPLRWCETFLVEPDTGEPWRFFEYQKDSIRAFGQDVVHQDGAEVGKTREIVAMVLWGQCTSMGFTVRRPWMLIGAPQQTHLDEIILAVEEQVGAHEDGSAGGMLLSRFWMKPKRTPHMMQRFRTIPLQGEEPGTGRVYYRPAGHDGEAFRGVHVNALLLMDEAAKLKRAVQWSEFWRSAKPGCCKRVYSVPDGDRSTEFFRLSQQAQHDLPVTREGWRLFHWPKTIMPKPFWSPEREAQLVRDFGGRHTPGFKRNVLGEWGEAENPIWSWDLILPNVHDLPDYRVLKLNVDRARREMHIEVKSILLHVEHGRKSGVEQWLEDATIAVDALMSRSDAERREAMRALLRANLSGDTRGVYWAGADLGESNDPTEIIVSEQRGPKLHDVLRISARGMDYYMQRELIYCLAELFGFQPHWGCDLGAAGTVVVKDLQTLEAYTTARFDECMSGFQFSNAVDCVGEDGEPLLDTTHPDRDDDKVLRAPAKHWASQCITKRLTDIGYTWPYDPEALNAMTNQTCRQGAKWPIYSKVDDHIPDARRMQMLRKLYDEGDFVDVFASGVQLRSVA